MRGFIRRHGPGGGAISRFLTLGEFKFPSKSRGRGTMLSIDRSSKADERHPCCRQTAVVLGAPNQVSF